MRLIDDISKAVTYGLDRAKFETERFQKISRIQGELNDLKRKIDAQLIEMGNRAYDLYRAGQIPSPSIAELVQMIDDLRAHLVVKEDELKTAQAVVYVETAQQRPPPVPVELEIPIPSPVEQKPSLAQQTVRIPQKKTCPVCKFEMPGQAVFCPNCGYRVGT
jgi:hypothetical protein